MKINVIHISKMIEKIETKIDNILHPFVIKMHSKL